MASCAVSGSDATRHQVDGAGQARLDALLAAFAALPEDDGPLRAWADAHGGVNRDVVLATPMSAGDNRGSPLYIACVLADADATAALLGLGADVNYRHPAPHGDTPVLHCAQQGYTDCLAALLARPELDLPAQHTRDFKLFLGQAVPQYEAGGRSPLLLAAVHNRLAAVRMLKAARPEWLAERDSFGRLPVEAVLHRVALSRDNEGLRASLMAIAREVAADPDADLEAAVPTFAAASSSRVERNRALRHRFVADELARNNRLRAVGLAAVEKHYKPLHADVRSRDIAPHLAPALQGSRLSRKDVKEVAPGVYSADLLSPRFATRTWEEFHHYEEQAKANPELGLPLHFRHDGNMGSLQDLGYLGLLKRIEDVVAPLVSELYRRRGPAKVYHAFLVRNWLGRQASHKIHTDKSDLTINICIHRSDDLEGSTVGFYKTPEGDGGVNDPPTESDRIFTYQHRLGRMVLHDGTKWHKTDDSTRGTRGSLIIWARFGPPSEREDADADAQGAA